MLFMDCNAAEEVVRWVEEHASEELLAKYKRLYSGLMAAIEGEYPWRFSQGFMVIDAKESFRASWMIMTIADDCEPGFIFELGEHETILNVWAKNPAEIIPEEGGTFH